MAFLFVPFNKIQVPKKKLKRIRWEKNRQFINNECKLSSPTKQIFDSLLHHLHPHASGVCVRFFLILVPLFDNSNPNTNTKEKNHTHTHTNARAFKKEVKTQNGKRRQNGQDSGKRRRRKKRSRSLSLNYSNAN